MKISNIEELSKDFIWQDEAGLISKSLGEAAKSEKIYVNIDIVPEGAYSTKYHSHSRQEEFFIIMSGKGILRLNGKEIKVEKGDFFAKPAGKGIAHTFCNEDIQDLVILDIGTIEPEDTCYYPDEDMYMQKSCGERRIFGTKDLNTSWTTNPNE